MSGEREPDGTRPVRGLVVAVAMLGIAAIVLLVLALTSGALG